MRTICSNSWKNRLIGQGYCWKRPLTLTVCFRRGTTRTSWRRRSPRWTPCWGSWHTSCAALRSYLNPQTGVSTHNTPCREPRVHKFLILIEKVDPESLRLSLRYLAEIEKWIQLAAKSTVSSITGYSWFNCRLYLFLNLSQISQTQSQALRYPIEKCSLFALVQGWVLSSRLCFSIQVVAKSAIPWKWISYWIQPILLPSATVVAERLCFFRCLSVHGRGDVYIPGQTPPRQTSPWAYTPQAYTPQADTPPRDGHCIRRYAFHWNAFLLLVLKLELELETRPRTEPYLIYIENSDPLR